MGHTSEYTIHVVTAGLDTHVDTATETTIQPNSMAHTIVVYAI